ncbi:MAG: tetratricopeptide repeat protein [Acidobacteria bacterium]|nr:tetratricopeptide repeat protein [Acidobacteriota bacterium]
MPLFLFAFFFWQAGDPGALSQQAKTALAAGRYEEAARLYARVLQQMPAHPGILLNLCIATHQAGRHAEAVKHCGQSALVPAKLFLGVSQLKLGKPELAVQPLETFAAANPAQPVAQLELATAYALLGRYAEAIPLYDALAINTPNDPRVFHGMGRVHSGISQQLFGQMKPGDAVWIALRARSKLAGLQYRTAYQLFRSALKAQPDFPGAHAAIAEIYRATGQPEWAGIEAKLEKNLPSPPAYSRVLEHEAKALAAFQRLEQLPPSPELHEIRAETATVNGDHAGAASNYDAALRMKPGDSRLERALALSLSANREFERSIPLLKKHNLPYELGAALLDSGDAYAALPPLQAAYKLDPARRALLGRALLAADQPAAALPHLIAAKLDDPDGSLHLQLSRAYQRLGRQAEAAAAVKVYLERQLKTVEPEITAPN